jgi:putative addiction module killer protein
LSPIDDNPAVRIDYSERFLSWQAGLRDRQGKARIAARLLALESGHWGDAKSVGGGVTELRIYSGPGYRLYLTRRGSSWVLLLCGGDKDTQSRDIATAQAMAEELRDGD